MPRSPLEVLHVHIFSPISYAANQLVSVSLLLTGAVSSSVTVLTAPAELSTASVVPDR